VDPGSAEVTLARSLTGFGIPVQARAGVAEDGVRRRWGDRYGALCLRWAHRDRAYLLRLAIDLDGQYLHLHGAKPEYDRGRNEILADRGWYVAHLSGQEYQWLALEPLVALVEQHRRAIVLARADLPALKRGFA
jgi:hypothetical protein